MNLNADSVRDFHCPRWEELPTLSLYMDQVLIVLDEALPSFEGDSEKSVTATMINNYVKQKVIEPPVLKKYGKEHIADLIMLCILKRVLSISEAALLISMLKKGRTIDAAYNLFCVELERALIWSFSEKFEALCEPQENDLSANALNAAMIAVAAKLRTVNIINAEPE